MTDAQRQTGAIAAALAGCIVYMLGAMSRVAVPGMVFERIVSGYGLTHAQVAMLPSVGVLGCMAFIGVGGMLVDRFGWMRMLLVGSAVQALGYVPVHESQSLAAMLAGEFLNGGGRTIVYLSILKLFDASFGRRRFAALIGVFYVFSYGGTLGASAVFPALMERCGSWQLAARAINYGTLAAAACIALLAGFAQRAKASAKTPESAREVFPWRSMAESFRSPRARLAIVATGLNIAVYWSFLCVGAAPFARTVGDVSLVSGMNWVVMAGMTLMGCVSLLFGNARRPFFVWGSGALVAAFATLLAASLCGARDAAVYRAAYLLVGAGYGVTSVLLAGTKECVPAVYMASAIGFTNFFANVVQIGTNQASGKLMAMGAAGHSWTFAMYLALAVVSFIASCRFAAAPKGQCDEPASDSASDSTNGLMPPERARRLEQATETRR